MGEEGSPGSTERRLRTPGCEVRLTGWTGVNHQHPLLTPKETEAQGSSPG